MPFTFPSDSTGKAGAIKITPSGDDFYVPVITGGHARAPFSGSSSITRSFTSPMQGLVLSNDGNADLSFIIGADTYTVRAGEVFQATFDPFSQVSINANVPFRGYVLGYSGSGQQTTDTIPPLNVPVVSTSGLTDTAVTLSWQASVSNDTTGYDIYNGSTFLASVTGLTYPVTGLTAGTQYTFWVKAKDLAGNVASGTNVSVTTTSAGSPPDTTPPANVASVTTSNVTQNGLTLTWPASTSTDVASYDVLRGTTLIANTVETTYSVTGLTAGTAYTFWVKAKDGSGNAASGTSVAVTTQAAADTTPPPDVTVSASNVTSNGVRLTWTANTAPDFKDYRVYNGATLLATLTNTTLYDVTGLTAGTAYTFYVKSRDAANNESSPGGSASVTTAAGADTTPPVDVTNLASSSTTQTGCTLTWQASTSSDVKDYQVYNGATLLVTVTTLSYNVTGLTAGNVYTFKVVTRDTSNNASTGVTLDVTTAAPDTTPPEPVTSLATGTIAQNSIQVTWVGSVATDLDRYEVAYSTDGTTFTVASAAVNSSSTSYTVTGLAAGTLYTIRVVAIDTSVNRSSPVTVQGTTTAAAPAPTPGAVVYQDNFDRADANTLGTGWTSSNLGIITNQVRNLGSSAGGVPSVNYVAIHDDAAVPADNIAITLDIAVAVPGGCASVNGIVFRYQDANNYWAFGRRQVSYANAYEAFTLERYVAGAVKYYPAYAPTVTYPLTLKVELRGDTFYTYAGAQLLHTVKDTSLQTAYKHGISAGHQTSARFDNFKIQDISNVAAPVADTTAPAAPSALVVNLIADNQFNFKWDKAADADVYWYEVTRNGAVYGEYAVYENATAATSQNRLITGLTHATNYTMGVKARDGSGNTSAETTINTRTAPAPVTNLQASNITATSLTLTWNASASAAVNAYRVYNGTTRLTNPDLNASTLTYTVTGLTASTTYTFNVQAIDPTVVPNLGYNLASPDTKITVATTA